MLPTLRCVQSQTPPANPLRLDKSGPATVTLGEQFAFTITVSFVGPASGVYVFDTLGAGLSFGATAASWQGAGRSGGALCCNVNYVSPPRVMCVCC
jgi:uncharacterized repeat protein (TIGR01451 family)